jgi:L-asparaginase
MAKKLVFLGMGGTIAGKAASASDNVGYKAGEVGVGQLLGAIPALAGTLGDWATAFEQVAQIDSKDMGAAEWMALAQRVQFHLQQPEVAAVVITHGTDTLEETAYFLSRVVGGSLLNAKPVVLTCAMRPASSQSSDGPQNVLDAVAVARATEARGVLAVCAGTAHSARDVQKIHPYQLDAFDSGDAGPLAYVEEGAVRWLHACPTEPGDDRLSGQGTLPAPEAWPRVEVVLSHAMGSGAMVRALCAAPPEGDAPVRGLVVAGTGNGTLQADLEAALRHAQAQGVRVLRTTRCAYGSVVVGASQDGLPSVGLSPVKARIALMLELMAS